MDAPALEGLLRAFAKKKSAAHLHGVQTPTDHRGGGVCLRACGAAWGLTFGLPEQRRGSGHEGMPVRKKGHGSKLATMLRKLELEIRSISACVPLLRLVRRRCPSRG